jgi:hypothetical protein
VTLGSLLDATETTAGEVASHVAGLSPADCLGECLALSAAQQRRLWQLASSTAAAPAGELLADTTAAFAGRNSLRLFSRFEKWFARQDAVLIGCNRHALSALIGPGYFIVRDDSSARLEFDYGRMPAQAPPGWPAIKRNTGLLARPVYGNLLDKVVWVSRNVLVGAAFRDGKPLDSYFVLVRTTR